MKKKYSAVLSVIVSAVIALSSLPLNGLLSALADTVKTDHMFNFASSALYTYDTSLAKGNYSNDFALENGKCNISKNGYAFRYQDGELAGLRILSGGSAVKAGKKLSVLKNTAYTVIARMRTASNGKAFSLNVKKTQNDAENIAGITTDTSSSKKNYYVASFNTGECDEIFIEFEAPSGGSGVIYSLAVCALSSEFKNGGFESGQVDDGWIQNYPTDPEIVTGNEAKSGNYALKLAGYSEVSSYLSVEPNTDYIITGSVKVSGAFANFQIQPMINGMAVSSSNAVSENNKYTAGNGWQNVSIPFNSGSNTVIWLRIIAGASSTVIIDDISVKKKEKTPVLKNTEYTVLGFSGEISEAQNNIDLFTLKNGAPNISGDGKIDFSTEGAMRLDARGKNQDIKAALSVPVKKNTQYSLIVRMRSMSETLMPQVSVASSEEKNLFAKITAEDKSKRYYTAEFETDNTGNADIIVEMPAGGAGLIYSISLIPKSESVINGTFESGSLNGWLVENGSDSGIIHKSVSADESGNVRRGYCALRLAPDGICSTYFYAESGTVYTVNISVKSNSDFKIALLGFNNSTVGSSTADKLYYGKADGNGKWQDISFEYTADENRIVWLCLEGNGNNTYIDNIYVNPKRTEISNGSFDTGLDIWRDVVNNSDSAENNYLSAEYTPIALTSDRTHGSSGYSLRMNGTLDNCEAEYFITLKPNTRYLLEYYAFVDNNGVKVFVFDTADRATDSKAYVNKAMYKKSEWVRNSYTFVSDEKVTTYRIVLRASGGNAYIDDISLTELPELITTDSLTKETNHILNLSDKKLYTKVKDDYVSNDFSNADRTANISAGGTLVYTEDGALSGLGVKADGSENAKAGVTLKVKPDTVYTLNVRMKSANKKKLSVYTVSSADNEILANASANTSDKNIYTYTFKTGNEEFIGLFIEMEKGGNGIIYNIAVTADSDIIQNGSFESGTADGWVQMYTKSASLARSPESNSGEYALKINGYSEYITYITLKENTDYEISAYVRGNSNSYIRLKSLTNGTTPSKMKTIAQKTATAGDKYKKVVFRFNSGSVTKVWLQLAVDEGKTAFFDDIKITAYNEPEPEDKTDHYFSFADEGLYKDTGIYNEKTSSNIFTNTDFALEDGSANISNNGIVCRYVDSGELAGIRFNANGGTALEAAMKLKVKPDTSYTLVTRMRTMTDGIAFTLKIKDKAATYDYVTLNTSTDKSKNWYTVGFETGAEDEVILYFLAPKNSSGLIYTLSLQENTEKLENGDFETGNTDGWVKDYNKEGGIVNAKTAGNSDNVSSGNAALMVKGYNAYSAFINAEPHTEYFWHGRVKTNGSAYVTALQIESGKTSSASSAVKLIRKKISAGKGWQEVSLTFNTGDNTIIWLNISAEDGTTAYFDDMRVQPLYDYVKDGDFEQSLSGWKNIKISSADATGIYEIATTPVKLSRKAHKGNGSMLLDGSDSISCADYVMKVQKDTRYYVFFWGFVTGTEADVSLTGLSSGDKAIKSKRIDGAGNWQRYILSVDTGENDFISLKFTQNTGGRLYVDQLEFATTVNGATLPNAVVTETKSRLWALKDGGVNLADNADFESAVSGSPATFINGSFVSICNVASSGNHGLHFKNTSDEEKASVLWVNVEKNTDYVFSLKVKAPYFSASNCGDITFGISDEILSDYITDKDGKSYCLNPPALDNEWHISGFEFNSGNQNRVGITIKGINAEAYFDELVLCKKTDAKKYSYGTTDGTAELIDYNPKNIGCAESDNLVKCFDFEGSDRSYWETGMGYKNFFHITDSVGDRAGKVLSINSGDLPTHNRYIKWVDVKKNTEYTVSVMYRCNKDSESSFSLFEKTYVGYVSVIDIEAGEAEDKWKNFAFTFNSGDNEQMGISFFDAGGNVLYNDIRFFEAAKGIYMEIPTYGVSDAAGRNINIALIIIIATSTAAIIAAVLIAYCVRRKRKKV